jgi:hypothetical protein
MLFGAITVLLQAVVEWSSKFHLQYQLQIELESVFVGDTNDPTRKREIGPSSFDQKVISERAKTRRGRDRDKFEVGGRQSVVGLRIWVIGRNRADWGRDGVLQYSRHELNACNYGHNVLEYKGSEAS